MSNDGTQNDGKKNLSLESLDQVVGGLGATPTTVKKGLDADLLTGAKGFIDIGGKPSGIVAGDEKWVNPLTPADMIEARYRNTIEMSLSQYIGGSSAANVGLGFDNFMKNGAGKGLSPAGWAIVYDVVLGSGYDNTARRFPSEPDHVKIPADMQEALKAKLRPHTEEITRGVVEKIKPGLTAQGALTTSINETGNVLARLMSKADSPQVREDLIAKAQAGYEKGLDTLKGMREYKAVADLISNPRSEDAWKTAVFEVGISAVTPTKVGIVKFLGEQMATSASLKFIGLGDYDPQVKQTARAMVNAMNTATDAVVDLYKNGFVAGMTMGLDVKGLIDIGKNVADFGKAVGKGDVDAMGKAAKALVVDALNDVKDGLEKFYVGGATKVAGWTKDITMGILNDLGATPYAEIAVQETKKALVDFGNKAKAGSEAAVNALADFATKDVARSGQQAINTLADVGKSGVREAEKAVNALADVAKSGARQAESAVNALADVGKSGVKEAEKAVNALGDVAKSGAREAEKAVNALADVGKSGAREAERAINTLADVGKSGAAYANIAIDQLKNLSGQFDSAKRALEGVANSGVKYAEGAWNSVKGTLEDVWNRINPF
jgi:hypothetical protein